MRTARVFLTAPAGPGDVVAVSEDAARHLDTVLRLRPGSQAVGVAPDGSEWDLAWLGSGRARVVRARAASPVEAETRVTLAVAVPRGERMDWLVEKAVELGVDALLPLWTDRSPLGAQIGPGRVSRWERLARAAAEQSGRRRVPTILPAADAVAGVSGFGGVCLMAHPAGEAAALRELLSPRGAAASAAAWRAPDRVLLAVGPEGGWSERELDAASEAGVRLLPLGPRILRVETAAVVALTLVLACCGALGPSAGRQDGPTGA